MFDINNNLKLKILNIHNTEKSQFLFKNGDNFFVKYIKYTIKFLQFL